VQGITGREASKVTAEMKAYGTKVEAGVTPGKGGQEVEGVPVYDTVAEAVHAHPKINASVVYVPPFAVLDASLEALHHDIRLLDVVTERVPTLDTTKLVSKVRALNMAEKLDAGDPTQNAFRVVGPTSVGILNPDTCKLGPIGGNNPQRVFTKGEIGVVSKSGSMTNETSWLLRQAGYGQSTALGIGGDVVTGSSFLEILELFERDAQTKAMVLFGELGGGYEEQAAQAIAEKKITKPVVAFVAGTFADHLPKSMTLGHAGAIIEGNVGSPQGKIDALRKAGALVANIHSDIPELLKEVL
jgi:succinyl-CoA synthetase alpha subunit